jgi:hypothetical protein
MFKNYVKIAWRNIARHKVHTAVNILGLSLGLCACISIYVISRYELSFDTFHPAKERIYRVMGDVTESTGDKLHFARVPLPVSLDGRLQLSGVEAIAGIIPFNASINIPAADGTAKQFDSRIAETHYLTTVIAEPQYFDVFAYDWLAGDAHTALAAPFKVVLTESKARQYFGPGALDAMIGKQVIYEDSLTVSVSGIVRDWHQNTDLLFTDFISFSTVQGSFLRNNFSTGSWAQNSMPAWVFTKLADGIKPERVNTQLAALVKREADPQVKLALWLEPLTDIHFNADIIENPIRTADKLTIYILMGIAAFILLLAVINFINLSTAQSIQRAKEVGVRKVLGSSSMSLVFQFLTETMLLTLFAVLLAASLVSPVLAMFRSFIPEGVSFDLFSASTLLFLLLVVVITTLLAGLYPARVLSSYLPALSLKGAGLQKGGEKWWLRRGLIVFQFSVSIVFIIGSMVIANQLKYTREKDLGFTADAVITIDTPRGDSLSKIRVLAQAIRQIPGINKVALQWLAPMTDNPRGMKLKFKSTDEKDFWVTQVAGNEEYIPLYKIKLLAGRNLLKSDSVREFVINESLMRNMGLQTPALALGKTLYWNNKPYPVVGVVADFHTKSLHDPVTPLCIINRPEREGSIAVKLASAGVSSAAIKNTLLQIEKVWRQVYPGATFNYRFYDETLALLYEKDQQAAMLMNTAMGVTIFISCIGLFGLTLFIVKRRAKEISIRKILGASVTNITTMLSRDFIILVVIALFIAAPVAWYFMDQWLQSFAYRVDISWWIFALAGIATLCIALATVSMQAIKAALANPVKSLRAE